MKPIVRVPLMLLLTAVAISLGVVGVHASTECVRFITKKVRRHKVSAATAARWAAWDKAHPNWHPKKKPAETLAQLDFACSVPVIEKPVDGDLPPLQLNTFNFAPDFDLAPPAAPPVTVAMNEPPQSFMPDQPSASYVMPPIYWPPYPTLFGPPPLPPPGHSVPPGGSKNPTNPTNPTSPTNPTGLTPEPSSWMMLATAVLAIGMLAYRRPQMAKVVARRRF